MDNNTILNLNSIIYQIYNISDFEQMKTQVLSSLRSLIPCVCCSILMNYDEDTPYYCDPVVIPENYMPLELAYIDIQEDDGSFWVLQKKQSTIFRDTELMSGEERLSSIYFKRCLEPYGLYYSVDTTITDGFQMLGIMTLYRTKEQGDFTNEEVVILRLLSDHINSRFSKEANSESDSELTESIKQKKLIDTFISDYDLTSREAEVLEMIFNGSENDEINEALCISPFTLKKHLQNLYRKMGVSGRVQLKALKP